ncbi:MAG: hypothetical protein AB7D35_11090, partial [Bacteroidales bacterium]
RNASALCQKAENSMKEWAFVKAQMPFCGPFMNFLAFWHSQAPHPRLSAWPARSTEIIFALLDILSALSVKILA